MISDEQGRVQDVIGREKNFTRKLTGKLLSSLVSSSYFQEAINFLLEVKKQKLVVGWEFYLKEDSNHFLVLFSGILVENNQIVIIVHHPFEGIKSLLPDNIKLNRKRWEGLLNNYFQKKKATLSSKSKNDNQLDEFYQQYSQMNNQLVNLQRQMVKKNKELEEIKERFRITLTGIADAIISVDSREQIEFINPVAMQLLGKKEEQIIGRFFWDIFQVTGKNNEKPEFIRKSLSTYGFYKGEDFTLMVNGEKSIPIDFNLSFIDRNKEESGAVLVFRDISERKKKEKKLNHFASSDMLTGIYNRRMGLELLEKEIRTAQRRKSYLTICYLDVDGLKLVNDQFGHQEGDQLLKKVVQIIKKNIRKSDTFCRMGGDEFLIIFPESRKEEAEEVWERILADFTRNNQDKDILYPLQASHGLVECQQGCYAEGKEIDRLIELADKKMYLEKQKHNKKNNNVSKDKISKRE